MPIPYVGADDSNPCRIPVMLVALNVSIFSSNEVKRFVKISICSLLSSCCFFVAVLTALAMCDSISFLVIVDTVYIT